MCKPRLVFNFYEDIIKIHLGDQADAKILLGTYVCTEIPGEFRWQQGALTQVYHSLLIFSTPIY